MSLPLRHYGVAVLLSALALVLMVLLEPLMEPSVFLLFVAAVAMSAGSTLTIPSAEPI